MKRERKSGEMMVKIRIGDGEIMRQFPSMIRLYLWPAWFITTPGLLTESRLPSLYQSTVGGGWASTLQVMCISSPPPVLMWVCSCSMTGESGKETQLRELRELSSIVTPDCLMTAIEIPIFERGQG